jgi:Xaa-Pro dipeptidase
MPQLYSSHLAETRRRYDQALAAGGFDVAVIGAGVLEYRHLDDQPHPYAASPDFLQWIPLAHYPGSCVVYRPGGHPVLLLLRPEDFWHEPPPLPPADQAGEFDVRLFGSAEDLAKALPAGATRVALVGPERQWDEAGAGGARNPPTVLNVLHYRRAWKTPWEVQCMRAAARRAAPGHAAARAAFDGGASEFEIHAAFLAACGDVDAELPYPAIIGLNRHCATLHYQQRDRARVSKSARRSLLIDAGCAVNGYACDITRTHAAERGGRFAAMIAGLDRVQQALCADVRPGVAFPDLQRAAHLAIGGLLLEWGLVRAAPEDQWAAGVTALFFPHGLGHLLGLQVHDLGGQMAAEDGSTLPQPADFPRLRLTRTLDAGQVLTIEPGVYFIDSLLERLRTNPLAGQVDWGLLGEVHPCGGIRIEDDVLVTDGGQENLTRPWLEDRSA